MINPGIEVESYDNNGASFWSPIIAIDSQIDRQYLLWNPNTASLIWVYDNWIKQVRTRKNRNMRNIDMPEMLPTGIND